MRFFEHGDFEADALAVRGSFKQTPPCGRHSQQAMQTREHLFRRQLLFVVRPRHLEQQHHALAGLIAHYFRPH